MTVPHQAEPVLLQVAVHMTIPPPGVPYSTTYVAPNSEVTTLSQRVDVPMVCITADVVREPPQGAGASQGDTAATARSKASNAAPPPADGSDVFFIMDEVTGLPRLAPPDMIPSPDSGTLDGGASSRSGLLVTGVDTGPSGLGSPGGMGATLTLTGGHTGMGSPSGTATPLGAAAPTAKAIRGLKAPFAVASDPANVGHLALSTKQVRTLPVYEQRLFCRHTGRRPSMVAHRRNDTDHSS